MREIQEEREKLETARQHYEAGLAMVHDGHGHFNAKNELVPRRTEVKNSALEVAHTVLNSILGVQSNLDTLRKLFSEGASLSRLMEMSAEKAESSFTAAELQARKASELILAVDSECGEHTTPPIDSARLLKDAATTSAAVNGRANMFCFSSRQSVDKMDRGLADIAKVLKSMVDQIPSHDQATDEDRIEMSQYEEAQVDATSTFTEAITTIDQRLNNL